MTESMADLGVTSGLVLHLVANGLDRAATRRTDTAWLRTAIEDPQCRAMWVCRGAVATIPAEGNPGPELLLGPAGDLVDADSCTFLGIDGQGRPCFAIHAHEQSTDLPPGPAQWLTLRELGLRLPGEQASMAVAAVALDNWRRRTSRCPGCGTELASRQAGWALHCPQEDAEHFPRTDPAAIVLVRDGQDRALLGRHVNWEPGWMSTIAGFVEAGESAEAAVRREVLEETGVRIGASADHLAYLGSQPWPFPASLMLGYHAWVDRTDPTAGQIAVDQTEIAEARWFSRADLQAACADGQVRLPPRLSISRYLIEAWFGEPLPGDWMRG
ncbi:MAG: NAD(+) diphosphatase [Actinomycetales bacterium]